MRTFLTLTIFLSLSLTIMAQDIVLPAPQRSGGKPLFDAINERQSIRDLANTPLDLQTLSDLLWAAYGFNREDRRVVPSPLNQQELFVYVVLKEGVYLYDAKANKLLEKVKGDYRTVAGKQDYVYVAPVNFLYVVDKSKETGTGAYISCGCAAQDVYLVSASKGLACVVRTGVDKDAVSQLLKLNPQHEVIAGQTIGNKK
ncbi:MAG: nitroreductase family protein [Planctomycetaceae bacterium]|jgi:nitroreductase|nr:nitroreductase family protein [Planctomycetaceae bacterium]